MDMLIWKGATFCDLNIEKKKLQSTNDYQEKEELVSPRNDPLYVQYIAVRPKTTYTQTVKINSSGCIYIYLCTHSHTHIHTIKRKDAINLI